MNGMRIFLGSVLLWSSLAQAAEGTDLKQMPQLILTIGEQRLLRIPQLSRFSLGNSKVRVLRTPSFKGGRPAVEKEALLIKAVEEGVCDLWIWKSDGISEHRSILIQKHHPAQTQSKLDRLVETLTEVEVISSGSQTILRGEILSLNEASRVASITRTFPNEVRDETHPSEDLVRGALDRIQAWLKSSGSGYPLTVEQIGGQLWVRGSMDRQAQREAVKKLLLGLYPLVQFEIDALPDASPTLSFKVFLLELRRSHFKSLGFFWGALSSGGLQVSTQGVQDSLQVDLAIHHLEGEGHAKVLSNPELVVRAPGEAELFAGGELPIVLKSRFNQSVDWKRYGLTLKLKVSHAAGQKVRLDIQTEVSHLGPAITSDGIPGIQTNRMSTQVDARFGSPLLLSGLLQNKIREEAKGIPSLRNIPILGSLFGSEDYLNERSELVAILFPKLNPPSVPQNQLRDHFPARPVTLPSAAETQTTEEREMKSSKDYPWNALE